MSGPDGSWVDVKPKSESEVLVVNASLLLPAFEPMADSHSKHRWET